MRANVCLVVQSVHRLNYEGVQHSIVSPIVCITLVFLNRGFRFAAQVKKQEESEDADEASGDAMDDAGGFSSDKASDDGSSDEPDSGGEGSPERTTKGKKPTGNKGAGAAAASGPSRRSGAKS